MILVRWASSTTVLYEEKKEITAILNHNEMNVPQKIHHLGNLLQQAMTPASALAEGAFVKQVASLQLPANHSISHSPSFEKDEITLSITFKDFVACEACTCPIGEEMLIKLHNIKEDEEAIKALGFVGN